MATVFVSTTWPSHVSLVTGVGPRAHGVVSNHILNRATARAEDLTGDPVYDAADLVRAPTIYDRAHAAGLRTAAIDWPATRRAASLDFNLPFFKSQRIFEAHTAPAVWAELSAARLPDRAPGRVGRAAQAVSEGRDGRGPGDRCPARATRRTCCSFTSCARTATSTSTVRAPRRRTGPIAYIDGLIGRLLTALGADGLDRTTVVVVSDHGFLPVSREVRPNVRLRRRGLLRLDAAGEVGGRRGAVRHESRRRLGLHGRRGRPRAPGPRPSRRAGRARGRRRGVDARGVRRARSADAGRELAGGRPPAGGVARLHAVRRDAQARTRPARPATAAPTASDRPTPTTARSSSPPVAASGAAARWAPSPAATSRRP